MGSTYTVRVDGDFIGIVRAETALEASTLLAYGYDYIEVTQASSGIVTNFNFQEVYNDERV